jgi:flagellar FliJ protein
MNGYVFKLERILNLKEEIEELRNRELTEAILALREEIDRKNEIEAEISAVMDEMRSGQKEGWSSLRYISAQRYLAYLNARLQEQIMRIKDANVEVNLRREKLVQAVKERKIFEKLKERDYRGFLERLSKREMEILDLVTTNGYHRKSRQTSEEVV